MLKRAFQRWGRVAVVSFSLHKRLREYRKLLSLLATTNDLFNQATHRMLSQTQDSISVHPRASAIASRNHRTLCSYSSGVMTIGALLCSAKKFASVLDADLQLSCAMAQIGARFRLQAHRSKDAHMSGLGRSSLGVSLYPTANAEAPPTTTKSPE